MPYEITPNGFNCAELPVMAWSTRQPIRRCPELVPERLQPVLYDNSGLRTTLKADFSQSSDSPTC
eukprot:3784691-Pleurochrysis_carterae.AAC.2